MPASSLTSTAPLRPTASLLTSFDSSKISSAFNRIDWIFWLCVTTGLSYCVYNLYMLYQSRSHTAFGLDHNSKHLKCQALLDEAKATNQTSVKQRLIDQCEALLASMPKRPDKDVLVLQLAQYYAENNFARTVQIAQSLSSWSTLFELAQSLQEKYLSDFRGVPGALFSKAYQMRAKAHGLLEDKQQPSANTKMQEEHKFARAFHAVQNDGLKQQAEEMALALIINLETDVDRFHAFCDRASYIHELKEPMRVTSTLDSAKKLLSEKLSGPDLISARLRLVYFFISTEEYEKMAQEIDAMYTQLEVMDPPLMIRVLNSSAGIVKAFQNNERIPSQFKTFDLRSYTDKACKFLETYPSTNPDVYSSVATAYQALGDLDKSQRAAGSALEAIQKYFTEATEVEIKSKINQLLTLLPFFHAGSAQSNAIMGQIESLLERVTQGKDDMGLTILNFCHQIHFQDDSPESFQKKYVANLKQKASMFRDNYLNGKENKGETPYSIINDLTTTALCIHNPDQRKAVLEEIEKLLPLVHYNEREFCTMNVAKAYLAVDRQKSLQLLESYEDHQATWHLIRATVTAVALGVIALNPNNLLIPPIAVAVITYL